ncbi:MAG: hypothetical protein ACLSAF_21475 [Intestinimonas sp.]
MSLCCALVLTHAAYNLGPLTVTVLNVGQGQSVVLRAGERTAVVDCGGSARRNAGTCVPTIWALLGAAVWICWCSPISMPIMRNGVLEPLARVKVDVLAVPDVERDDPLRRELLSAAEESGHADPADPGRRDGGAGARRGSLCTPRWGPERPMRRGSPSQCETGTLLRPPHRGYGRGRGGSAGEAWSSA